MSSDFSQNPTDEYVPPKDVLQPTPTPTTVAEVARDNFQKDAFTPPGQETKDGLPGNPPAADGVTPATDAVDSLDSGHEFYCSFVGDATIDTPQGRQQALEDFRTTLGRMSPDEASLFQGEFSPKKLAEVKARAAKPDAGDTSDPTKKKPGTDSGEEKTEKKPEAKKDAEEKDSIRNSDSWFGNFVRDSAEKAVTAVSDIVHDALGYFGKYGEGILDSLGLTSSTKSGDGQKLATAMLSKSDSQTAKQAFDSLDKVENGTKLESLAGGLLDQARANGDLTTGSGKPNADKLVDANLSDGHTAAKVKEMLAGKFKGDVKTDSKTGEKIQTDGKGNTRIESKDGKNVTLKLSDGTVVNQKTDGDKTSETFLFGKKDGKDGGFMRTATDNNSGQTNFEFNDGKNYQQQADLARLVMSKDRYSFVRCDKDQKAIHADKDRATLVDEKTKNHVGIDRANGDIVINSKDKDGVSTEVRMRLNSETGSFDFYRRGEDGKDTKLTAEQVDQVKKQLQLTGSGDQFKVGNTEINRQLVSQLLSTGVRQEIRGGNPDGSVGVRTTDTNTGRGLDGRVAHPSDGGKTTTNVTDKGKPTGVERIFDPTTARIDGTDGKGNPIIFDPTTGQLKTPEIDKDKDGAAVKINDTDTKIKPDGSVVDADGFVIMDGDGMWWGDERDCCGMTPQQFEQHQAEQRAQEQQARALGSQAYSMLGGNVNISTVNLGISLARHAIGAASQIDDPVIRSLAMSEALNAFNKGNQQLAAASSLQQNGLGDKVGQVLKTHATITGPSSDVNALIAERDDKRYSEANQRNNVEDLDAWRKARGLA
ncbi:MAG: hypothetical protein K2X93_10230 [Candidatus Obscuribacterales bacterium]|nr:hypothetical protein [Candidatus Obscuribacterales bacterium]